MKINFQLNGEFISIEVKPTDRLLDILRNRLGIFSVKEGCGEGECGACAVIFNGKLTNSCLIPMIAVDGTEIQTIEGIKGTKEFKLIKESMEQAGAVQCGFCTPGMVLAIYTYLKNGGKPDNTAIRKHLSGNLCRCTGYNMIVDAVKLALSQYAKIPTSKNKKLNSHARQD